MGYLHKRRPEERIKSADEVWLSERRNNFTRGQLANFRERTSIIIIDGMVPEPQARELASKAVFGE